MTNREFADRLMKLAKEHENDEVSVFDTPWAKVVREAAVIIINMDKELKSKDEDLNKFTAWFDENYDTIHKAFFKPTDIDLPKITDEPERPVFNGWDGVRRDMETEPEVDVEGVRDLYPIKED